MIFRYGNPTLAHFWLFLFLKPGVCYIQGYYFVSLKEDVGFEIIYLTEWSIFWLNKEIFIKFPLSFFFYRSRRLNKHTSASSVSSIDCSLIDCNYRTKGLKFIATSQKQTFFIHFKKIFSTFRL